MPASEGEPINALDFPAEANERLEDVERKMELKRLLLRTETVAVCAVSDDPGCLGTFPSWHPRQGMRCDWVDVDFRVCLCGAHEMYGLRHERECPLHPEADPI